MNRKLLAALFALTAVGCGTAYTPPPEELAVEKQAELKAGRATATTTSSWMVRVSKTSTNPTWATSFTISSTYDVFAAFDVPSNLAGDHVAHFEFISPDGAVFQRSDVPFNMGSSSAMRVWASLPVAGTWIQQYQMVGTWSVKVKLDADTTPRASVTFKLR